MKTHFSKTKMTYTGEQLRSHWIRRTFGVEGDAIAAFTGRCEVADEHIVDVADLMAENIIRARRMLHFLCEFFDPDLKRAVFRQRLLLALAAEHLRQTGDVAKIRRDGDDLYITDRKLSVSIATVSPVSALIHLGLNIDPQGAPVAAIGIEELGIEPAAFAKSLMEAYVRELDGVEDAVCRARPVS